jgi:DNA-binding LacI/PurR family transcriptional regulator
VSRQTVSNVVNSRGRVGEGTRDRVRAAIDQLGYHPHRGARSMRSRRTRQIAHPMRRTELASGNLVMLDFIQALVAAAGRHGQHVLLGAAADDGLEDIDALIRSGSVDGFLLADITRHDARVDLLARQRVPFAAFGRTDPEQPQTWVDIDNEAAIGSVVEHLVARGHTRIGFLGYDSGFPWDVAREAGYRDAMTAAGLQPDTTLSSFSPPLASRIENLLAQPTRPTAMVTGSDTLAAAVYAVAAALGRRIGADLAVAGFDGSAVSRLLSPRLTTIAIPLPEIADRLVARILRETEAPTGAEGELVDTVLEVGEST